MSESRDQLLIGRIVGVHGIQGWLKVHSFARPHEAIFDYRPWQLRQHGVHSTLKVVEWRAQGRGLVFRTPAVEDRTAAEALIGAEIWINRSCLPATAPGEYYWADLEGLQVRTESGVELGKVDHLLATGANDVLVVHGDRERLIPFVNGKRRTASGSSCSARPRPK
jgi:16S rRNA processing protein RimM